MANTQPGQASFSIEDILGSKASLRIPFMVDPLTTVAEGVAVIAALGGKIDNIIEGKVAEGRFELLVPNTGLTGAKTDPGADSRVEENGTFNFGNGTTSVLFPATVPSFLDSKLTADRINTADTDVAGFFNFVLASMTSVAGGGVFTNLDRRALNALVDTFYSFRKHRRSLSGSKIPYVAP